jgi:HK97 gp10 family phage protein
MRDFDLAGFAAFLMTDVVHDIEKAKEAALIMGASAIAAEARRVIGQYADGYDWPQLAQSTQADRARQGYAPNEPLLRTAELRDSIGFTIVKKGELAEIGSNDPVAEFQELGTSTIRPRPFLSGAAQHLEHDIVKMCGKIVADAIREAGHLVNIEVEIWRLAVDIAKDFVRDVKETAEDLADPNTEPPSPGETARGVGRTASHIIRRLK